MKRLLPALLSTLCTFSVGASAFAAPIGPITVEETPCSNDRTIANTICQMGRRGLKVEQALKQTEGRTLTILGKRKADPRSHLVPLSQQKPMRVDLRPESEREKELQKKRRSILEEREMMQEPLSTPLMRVRARSGIRGEALPPVCGRRHGLELIKCLTELGIEISPRTADEATLKLYEEQQKAVSD